jgi:hypothetical protein
MNSFLSISTEWFTLVHPRTFERFRMGSGVGIWSSVFYSDYLLLWPI